MRTFKVISLSVGGSNNKIFKSGDIVTENQFPQGNADKLVKGGFLKEILEDKPKAPVKSVLAEINSEEAEKSEVEETSFEDKKSKKSKRY